MPFLKNGTSSYIDNVETRMMALLIDDIVLPVTVNFADYNNSYVCSPYGHYVGYCHDQLSGKRKKLFAPLIDSYGSFYKLGKLNRVVMVNNWLYSTNLYPNLDAKQIQEIKEFLVKKFPHHAIVFRSINDYELLELKEILREHKFHLVPSRIVYFTKADSDSAFKSRMFKSDLSILKNSTYEISSLEIEDAARAAELYHKLNIEKHSKLNPQFNSQFIKMAIENNFLSFKGLRRDGRLDAVVGYYSTDKVMTSPLFGYDTDLPGELGLYRQLSTILLQEAKEAGKLLHQSSGAGDFKKLRRAESAVEYNAVYTKHLPFYQKASWSFLNKIMNTVGLSAMRKMS